MKCVKGFRACVQRGAKLPGVRRLCDGDASRSQLVEVAAQPADALTIGLENLEAQLSVFACEHRQAERGTGAPLSLSLSLSLSLA